MRAAGSTVLLAALAAGAGGCHKETDMPSSPAATQSVIASHAQDVQPLPVGERAPDAALRRPDGQTVRLGSLLATKPSILIFYRGGWCPYCNTHLGQIAEAEAELVKRGYQVLAISPDRPESLRATLDKGDYKYQLLSDSDMTLTKAFGLAFQVDDPTVEQYHGFGIDLDAASGRSHHLLPVPAVYIVDRQGVIRFAHWDPDYKKRLGPQELLSAASGAIER